MTRMSSCPDARSIPRRSHRLVAPRDEFVSRRSHRLVAHAMSLFSRRHTPCSAPQGRCVASTLSPLGRPSFEFVVSRSPHPVARMMSLPCPRSHHPVARVMSLSCARPDTRLPELETVRHLARHRDRSRTYAPAISVSRSAGLASLRGLPNSENGPNMVPEAMKPSRPRGCPRDRADLTARGARGRDTTPPPVARTMKQRAFTSPHNGCRLDARFPSR